MQINRTKNAVRNIVWGGLEKVVALLLPFVVRTVLIKVLGVEYLGLSNLFTSILTVLNITNLGFDTAIVFSMYKPIAEDDDETVCALLNVFRKIYHVVGSIVLVIGLCIIPFLPYLIQGEHPADVNLYVLYGIYLFDTVIGYFTFAYKASLFRAYQRNDVPSKRGIVFNTISNIMQIILLIVFKNYYAYIIMAPIICVATNISNAYIAKKMFPQITPRGSISDVMKKDIKKRVAGLVSVKIYSVIFTSVDSIVISAFLGLKQLALYNNYYFIQSTINGFILIFTNSIIAGIGHKMVTNSIEDNYTDFKGFVFINAWISGWCAVCLACLYQPFMNLWLGESMLLPIDTMLLIVLLFLFPRLGLMAAVYRESAGLWWEDRFRQWVAAVVNLSVNLVLVRYIGLNGVIISTLICTVFINVPWGGYVLFKTYFKKSPLPYFGRLLGYFLIIAATCAITYFACSFMPYTGILSLLTRGTVCVIVPNAIFLAIFYKTTEFAFAKDIFMRIIGNKLKTLLKKENL